MNVVITGYIKFKVVLKFFGGEIKEKGSLAPWDIYQGIITVNFSFLRCPGISPGSSSGIYMNHLVKPQ